VREFALFAGVTVLHFGLSVLGILFALPAAFDAQGGFWNAPGKTALAWMSGLLLAPLAWLQPVLPPRAGFAYGEIFAVSVAFGAAAVGLARIWRAATAPSLRPH
jgi:hypothetical protein